MFSSQSAKFLRTHILRTPVNDFFWQEQLLFPSTSGTAPLLLIKKKPPEVFCTEVALNPLKETRNLLKMRPLDFEKK